MKQLLIISYFLIFSTSAYAGISVCSDSSGNVTSHQLRGGAIEGCEYYDVGQSISQEQDDALRTLLKTVPTRYLKMKNGFPVEMVPQEQVLVDDALAAQITAQEIQRIDSGNVTGQEVLKALPAVIADSGNYKELTEEVIKEKIKVQAGLKP